MREAFRPIVTNLTPVRVIGVPGLMLVFIAIALAWQFPEARWLIASGVAGGAAIAAVLVARRRRRSIYDDDRWSHGMLGVSHDDTYRRGSLEPDRARGDRNPWRGPVHPRLDPLHPLTSTAARG